MKLLDRLPTEIFDSIIEYLVVTIGIVKALRLRVVNRTSNSNEGRTRADGQF